MIKKTIGGRECLIYDCGSADTILIQPVDDHDIEVLDSEVAEIKRLLGESAGTAESCGAAASSKAPASSNATEAPGAAISSSITVGFRGEAPGAATGSEGFTLVAFRVGDWNDDLSPWEAPAVFGDKGFGGGAESTLEYVEKVLVPEITGERIISGRTDRSADAAGLKLYIGGYSLAAFFALWAVYKTDIFSGAAAASPSVWFPGWIDFAEKNEVRAQKVYLSLGDKEEKTRNPVMRTVGDCLRRQHELLEADPRVECTLEMNQGNHFKDADLRTAKGFAWLLGSGCDGLQTR